MKFTTVLLAATMLLPALLGAQEPAAGQREITSTDLLSAMRADSSFSFFVMGLQRSGLALKLRHEGPFTVFAVKNQAFVNLAQEEREVLLNDRAAMFMLLSHYLVPDIILANDKGVLSTTRTLTGTRLHTDFRQEAVYVNGAALSQDEIRCANGVVYPLGVLDPLLVRRAIDMARSNGSAK